ncbi:dihydroorotate dehydrogenase [Paenibacillus sp. J22TS3]|uniref:dihydroorotate dehydrogenase n=1 Tax=Paenibacillus sp. J22TS3 TaxID=2807192 RepID=UPI001B0D57B8|nr:dihydroorotate dehydrogenase [Paenibacillus sp. J22TS3]GIP19876.1 dihydroorotate dehydrogenase B (NAD(+)), catalytic subunit [Paenibacillus sp. J22TS3]
MLDLSCTLAGVHLKNPLIMASGTFGFGKEYTRYYDISKLGGISGKGLTLNPKQGNSGLRIYETASGIMNSVGLENPGIPAFLANEANDWEKLDLVRIVNLGGDDIDQYVEGAKLIREDCRVRQARGARAVDMIELNISCPNVKQGGAAYGIKTRDAREVVQRVRDATSIPLLVKLSPDAEDLVGMAGMCEEEGADGITLINTISAMKIDVYARKSVFQSKYAGLSGPAVKPIALRMVHQVACQVNLPVIGAGGISCATDIVEFIMAGAAAVQVGTHNFIRPQAGEELLNGLIDFMNAEGICSLDEIRGIV